MLLPGPLPSYYRLGIKPGTVIKEVNRKSVVTTEVFESLVAELLQKGSVLLLVRNGRIHAMSHSKLSKSEDKDMETQQAEIWPGEKFRHLRDPPLKIKLY